MSEHAFPGASMAAVLGIAGSGSPRFCSEYASALPAGGDGGNASVGIRAIPRCLRPPLRASEYEVRGGGIR